MRKLVPFLLLAVALTMPQTARAIDKVGNRPPPPPPVGGGGTVTVGKRTSLVAVIGKGRVTRIRAKRPGKFVPLCLGAAFVGDVNGPQTFTKDGHTYHVAPLTCGDATLGLIVCDDCPPPPPPDPGLLIRIALEDLPLPQGVFSPPITERDRAIVLPGFPFFYGVDPADWHPHSATVIDATGFYYVQTTAVPKRIELDAGDADTETCNGPGRRVLTSSEMHLPDACSHVYTHVAGTATDYLATLRIVWDVTVASNIPGAATGPFEFPTEDSYPIPVREVQAVNTA